MSGNVAIGTVLEDYDCNDSVLERVDRTWLKIVLNRYGMSW